MATVFERVREIIIEQLGVEEEEVNMDTQFRGKGKNALGADSLDLVELIMAFEEEFGGEISDEEAQDIKTVKNAVDYLEAHGAG